MFSKVDVCAIFLVMIDPCAPSALMPVPSLLSTHINRRPYALISLVPSLDLKVGVFFSAPTKEVN